VARAEVDLPVATGTGFLVHIPAQRFIQHQPGTRGHGLHQRLRQFVVRPYLHATACRKQQQRRNS
jgi:hypothetical protein